MNTTSYHLLFLVGASQGFLLAIFLALKPKRLLNIHLIFFLLFSSIELLFQYLYATKSILGYPHLIYVSEPFNVLYGVLIYLYLRNVNEGKLVAKKYDILFFVPFFAYLGYYLDFYLEPAAEKIQDLLTFYEESLSSPDNLKEWCFEWLATIPFLSASLALPKKQPRNSDKNTTSSKPSTYENARRLLGLIIVLYFLEAITILLAFWEVPIAKTSNGLVYLLCTIAMYLIGYDALVKEVNVSNELISFPELSLPTKSLYASTEEAQSETPKYKKNVLSTEKTQEICAKIIQCMEEDKLYRNPNFRISDLAAHTHENPNNISQVINDIFKQNFYDFVNTYRVEEAKVLLKSDAYKNYAISAIGFEVGFNSKSTFYAAFKKNTALSPVQFQNS